jgi:hypothetical protein
MRRTRALLLVLFPLAACSSGGTPADETPKERPRGLVEASDRPQVALPAKNAAAPAAAEADEPVAAEAVPGAAEEEKKDEAPPRDYGAELLAALGAPIDCLRPRTDADAPSELRIDVQAYLLETGFVSRAYVRAPSLDASEVQCLTKRASALRLAAPIEQAPRSVATTLTLTMKAAENPPAQKQPEPAPETKENP